MLQIGFKYFPFKAIDLQMNGFTKLPEGIKIVQLSDLHLHAKVSPSYLELLTLQINAKNPDLVLFTGDIIECSAKKIQQQLDTFKNIKAPTYYVTGNHDIFYGKDELKKILEKNNIICLDNRCVRVKVQNEFLQLVGVSDRYSFLKGGKRPLQKLFSNIDKNLFTILLAHQPKDIEHIKKARVDIQLSGHTHGGQIFPLSCFIKIFQPYFKGFYHQNKTLLYVSTGLGYWGIGIYLKV